MIDYIITIRVGAEGEDDIITGIFSDRRRAEIHAYHSGSEILSFKIDEPVLVTEIISYRQQPLPDPL